MFDSDPLIWLQGFATTWLTAVMTTISFLGRNYVHVVIALALAFGFSLRRGMVLLQILVWNDVLTNAAKQLFALPRPAAIDSAVELPDAETLPPKRLRGGDADEFLSLPEERAIRFYRTQIGDSYGFPSGHVSAAAAFGLGLANLLRSRKAAALAGVYIIVMALSRMYLGRHFLADTLGGLVLGVLVVGGVLAVRRRFGVTLAHGVTGSGVARRARILFLVAPVFGVALLNALLGLRLQPDELGQLTGLNLATLLVLQHGLPKDCAPDSSRIVRVLIALVAYFAATGLTAALMSGMPSERPEAIFLKHAVPPLLYLWGTLLLTERLGLYAASSRPARAGQLMG